MKIDEVTSAACDCDIVHVYMSCTGSIRDPDPQLPLLAQVPCCVGCEWGFACRTLFQGQTGR